MLTTRTVLLKDDFRQGLDLTRTWAVVRVPPSLIADDGIASTSGQGLYVRAAGTNPLTGQPAFTKTSPADSDHVKWMADTQHLSSNSMPGFNPVLGEELQINMWACGRTLHRGTPVRKRRDKLRHRPEPRHVRDEHAGPWTPDGLRRVDDEQGDLSVLRAAQAQRHSDLRRLLVSIPASPARARSAGEGHGGLQFCQGAELCVERFEIDSTEGA